MLRTAQIVNTDSAAGENSFANDVAAELPKLNGTTATWAISEAEVVEELCFNNQSGDPMLALMLARMILEDYVVPMPDPAIGDGAIWTATSSGEIQEVQWNRSGTYRLSLTTGRAHVGGSFAAVAAPGIVALDGSVGRAPMASKHRSVQTTRSTLRPRRTRSK